MVLLSPICLRDSREVAQQQREFCGLKSCCQSMDGKKEISSSSWCSFLQGMAVLRITVDGDENGGSSC